MKVTVGVIGKNEQHPNDSVAAHTMAALNQTMNLRFAL